MIFRKSFTARRQQRCVSLRSQEQDDRRTAYRRDCHVCAGKDGDDYDLDDGVNVGDDVGYNIVDEEFAGPPLPACIQYLSPTSASGPFAITAFHNRWPPFQISVQILILITFL